MILLISWIFVLTVIFENCSGISFNQPNLSSCALWNLNAITIANENLIGQQPTGIFINTQNTIYVVARRNNYILIGYNGLLTQNQTIFDDISDSWSLFVTDIDEIFVDNGYNNHRIDKWSLNDTNNIPIMSVSSSCTGLFIDNINNLYCSSANEHQIMKLDLNQDTMTPIIVAGIGCPGPLSNMLDHPHGIFIDENLNLYIADTDNNRIQFFSPNKRDGITIVGFDSLNFFILNKPTAVILDGNNQLYIVDSGNDRIIRSTTDTSQCILGCSHSSGILPNQLNNPHMMAFDSNGNIFVTDFNNHRVQKFNIQRNFCPICTPVCVNGGTCSNTDVCTCTAQWEGPRCQTPICSQGCLNGAYCIRPGQCQCVGNWQGYRCETPVCPQGCFHGGYCTGPGMCTCPYGRLTPTCLNFHCPQGCYSGICIGPGQCRCHANWYGAACSQYFNG